MKKKVLSWEKSIRWSFILVLGGLLIGSIIGCNQTDTDATTQRQERLSPVEQGERLYVAYCQMCHGEHGDGAMAELLTESPPDLTRIAARRDGKFPNDDIVQKVSGKDRILGHAETEMPVFWVAIKNGENLVDDHEVEERIKHLVRYLKSIQEKG